jgi:hypothetical protein
MYAVLTFFDRAQNVELWIARLIVRDLCIVRLKTISLVSIAMTEVCIHVVGISSSSTSGFYIMMP